MLINKKSTQSPSFAGTGSASRCRIEDTGWLQAGFQGKEDLDCVQPLCLALHYVN